MFSTKILHGILISLGFVAWPNCSDFIRLLLLLLLLFPDSYTVLRSDRVSANKTGGGGVLIALSSRIRSFKRRYDLQLYDECVWLELPTMDSLNLLIGNHYFPPDTKPEFITNYFRSLENKLDTQNFRVIMVGDFNTPGFDWNRGLSVPG
jgi:hypothetical protein